jgi:hypothetical protein
MIEKFTRLTMETAEIVDIIAIARGGTQIRRRRGLSSILSMQRSGAISIALQGMIWKSA